MAVSIAEAKRRLSELLIEARSEPVVITRRNEPDSVIIPYDDYVQLRRLQGYTGMLRIGDSMKGRDIDVEELIEASRRQLEEESG